MSVRIGVLSVQGDVAENLAMARQAIQDANLDGTVQAVMAPDEIDKIDGLIIPGGESTTIGHMSMVGGALKQIKARIEGGMPVMGICAGMILLSKSTSDKTIGRTDQPLLGLLDVQIERNSFGRQRESFEAKLSLEAIGVDSFPGVFIRAPSVSKAGSKVETVSRFGERIVAVRQDHILGVAFHPELTQDSSIHRYFVGMANRS